MPILEPDVTDLITCFNACFQHSMQTQLVAGDGEPIYLPMDESNVFNRVVFAHGYFSSALHEIAHWCIAGKARLMLEDYGYWYAPDGRDAQQQAEFEQVEVKPQALEWILAKACGKSFRLSFDNLSGVNSSPRPFADHVYRQLGDYLEQGLPPRAQQLIGALLDCFNQTMPSYSDFELSEVVAD